MRTLQLTSENCKLQEQKVLLRFPSAFNLSRYFVVMTMMRTVQLNRCCDCQCYKNFYTRYSEISQSVCTWQTFLALFHLSSDAQEPNCTFISVYFQPLFLPMLVQAEILFLRKTLQLIFQQHQQQKSFVSLSSQTINKMS